MNSKLTVAFKSFESFIKRQVGVPILLEEFLSELKEKSSAVQGHVGRIEDTFKEDPWNQHICSAKSWMVLLLSHPGNTSKDIEKVEVL